MGNLSLSLRYFWKNCLWFPHIPFIIIWMINCFFAWYLFSFPSFVTYLWALSRFLDLLFLTRFFISAFLNFFYFICSDIKILVSWYNHLVLIWVVDFKIISSSHSVTKQAYSSKQSAAPFSISSILTINRLSFVGQLRGSLPYRNRQIYLMTRW